VLVDSCCQGGLMCKGTRMRRGVGADEPPSFLDTPRIAPDGAASSTQMTSAPGGIAAWFTVRVMFWLIVAAPSEATTLIVTGVAALTLAACTPDWRPWCCSGCRPGSDAPHIAQC